MRRANTMYIMNESNYHFQNKFLRHNTPVQIYHSAPTLLTSRSDRKIWQQNLNLILSLVLSYNSIHFSYWTIKYRISYKEYSLRSNQDQEIKLRNKMCCKVAYIWVSQNLITCIVLFLNSKKIRLSWANARVKLHSQVHFRCIKFWCQKFLLSFVLK